MHIGAKRVWSNSCSKRLTSDAVGKVTSVFDIDFQTSIQSRADHLMDISSLVNEPAGMSCKRMGKHITLTKERNDPF